VGVAVAVCHTCLRSAVHPRRFELPFTYVKPVIILQVIAQAEDGVEHYMENMGLFGKDRPDKDAEAVILTKYIVSPDRSIEFIKAFKCVSFWLMVLYIY